MAFKIPKKAVKVTIQESDGSKIVYAFSRDKKIKSVIDNAIKELSNFKRPKTHFLAKEE